MSKRHGAKLPPFTSLFRHTTNSAAWAALSVGARAAFFEIAVELQHQSAEHCVPIRAHRIEEAQRRRENGSEVAARARALRLYRRGTARTPWRPWRGQGDALSTD